MPLEDRDVIVTALEREVQAAGLVRHEERRAVDAPNRTRASTYARTRR